MINANLYSTWERLINKALNECEFDNQNAYTPFAMCAFGMTYISSNKNKQKSIYIELNNDAFNETKLQKINGLNFKITNVPQIDPSKKYLVIESSNSYSLDEAFEAFSVTLVNNINSSITFDELIDSLNETLEQYKDFFSNEKNKSLSKSEEQGLFGELLFLKEIIIKKGCDCVRYWTGPQKNKHDFIFDNNVGVEVKTISSQIRKNISISNENQLKFEDRKKLFLKVYVLENNPTGELLSSLINQIILLLSNVEKRIFTQKLFELGIDPNAFVSKYLFANVGEYTYCIDNSFPRISKQDINASIFDVKYKINIDEINCWSGEIENEL